MLNSSLIKIATFDDTVLAHLALNRLEFAGLKGYLDGEHLVAMDWAISNAVGGIKLLVASDDREEACRILEVTVEKKPSNLDKNVDGKNCRTESDDRYHAKRRRNVIILAILLIGIPVLLESSRVIYNYLLNG